MRRFMDDYIVGPTLGRGGFSFVKLGIHKDTQERVALKILKKDKLNLSASTKKQVEREVAALERIQHKNIIRLKHVNWDAKYPKSNGQGLDVILIVLELATGGELFEFLSFTGSFEETLSRTYFHQLIDGVECSHRAGVAHRDLKPENLLLDSNFTLKIADFGFAATFSGLTNNSSLMFTECGTPGYMAPEVFKTVKGYDPAVADIWACGVILFIMLAGFPPFQKPHVNDWWFNKLATGKHALFWQAHCRTVFFSDSVKDFINKILCPDASKRMTLADIRKHPWFNGPVISDVQLLSELTRRKNDVDEHKARQKNAQDAATAQRMMSESTSMEVDMVRDVPMIPSAGVEFSSAALVNLGPSSFQDAFAFAGDEDAKAVAEAKKEEKLSVFKETVQCYTRFSTHAKPSVVMQKLTHLLENMGVRFKLNAKLHMVRGDLVTETGMITLSARLYADASAPNTVVVVFKRLDGDGLQYRSTYTFIREKLADLIIQPKQVPAAASTVIPAAAASSAAASSAACSCAASTPAAVSAQ